MGTLALHPVLPAMTHATIISADFLVHNPSVTSDSVDFVFTPTSQSSGSLVASTDTISLVDANNEIQNDWSWQNTATNGKLLTRQVLQEAPLIYSTLGTSEDWRLSVQDSTVVKGINWIEAPIDSSETNGDDDPSSNGGESADPLPDIILPLQITELLPNAFGSDTGSEFVEVYNPNIVPISGDGYRLYTGVNLDKSYAFPEGFVVAPLAYAIFKNDVVKFSLSNIAGAVQLSLNGTRVGLPITYMNPLESEAWAYVHNEWQYTNNPTPSGANRSSTVVDEPNSEVKGAATLQKPCAENQYRNPGTGRCKLITTEPSAKVPCNENQTRNPDTGRCRNAVAASTPTPCKAGQERNPETNRCRNIVQMTKAGSGLKVSEKTQSSAGMSWYMWVGIGGVVVAILSYAIWEWREEMKLVIQKVKARVLKRPN